MLLISLSIYLTIVWKYIIYIILYYNSATQIWLYAFNVNSLTLFNSCQIIILKYRLELPRTQDDSHHEEYSIFSMEIPN